MLALISTNIWDNVITKHRFSTTGAAQLHADLEAICRVVNKAVGPGVAEAGLRKCLEGAQLVGLAVKGGKDQASSPPLSLPSSPTGTTANDNNGGEADDAWDAWGAAGGGEGDVDEAGVPQKAKSGDTASGGADLGLWEVERRLFADNQSAREVLDALGLEVLSETEARALLRQRVELAD